jgi:hypothetical protein
MDRRSLLQSLGLVGLTAGTVGLTAATTYWMSRRTRFSGGRYLQMGTSVTSDGMTPAIAGERLGIPSLNVAFPGVFAGQYKTYLDPMSLYCLTDAVISREWSPQIERCTGDPRYRAPLSRLMSADFGGVTYLGLEYGTNEFHYDIPIGEDADFSKESFKGALNSSIEKLLTAFPKLRLFLITPSWMLTHDDRDSDQHPNATGIFLRDYVEAMLKVAQLNHIPCLDMWRSLGINKTNYKTFTPDGTHPNEFGARRRGEVIASFVNSVF